MKICILTGIFPPDIGGPATYVQGIAEEFSKKGIKVAVLTYSSASVADKKYNFKLIKVSRNIPPVLRHLLYFLQAIRLTRKSEVVYAQNLFSVGIPGFIASKILRRKFIVKIVGDYVWEKAITKWDVQDSIDDFHNKKYNFKIELWKKFQVFLTKRANLTIVPSFYLKDIVKKWGVKDEKIRVIYNALSKKTKPNISKEEAKKRIGFSGDIILSVGRLSPWKGFPALIEVVADLIKENPIIKLLIVGEGEERAKLESKIKELKVERGIKLIGKVDREEMPFYFLASDIFVLNSHHEGLPHVVLESMYYGTSVIVSSRGGNTEIIENGFNGFVVEYNNKNQLEQTIIRLLKSEDLQKKFTQNSFEKLKEFSWENLINKTLDILKSL